MELEIPVGRSLGNLPWKELRTWRIWSAAQGSSPLQYAHLVIRYCSVGLPKRQIQFPIDISESSKALQLIGFVVLIVIGL